MGAEKKIPIAEIKRSYNRYTFFDDKNLSSLEKSYHLENALKDFSIESVTDKDYQYKEEAIEQKRIFITQENYNLFIADVKALLKILSNGSTTSDVKKNSIEKIIEEIHNHKKDVDKIMEYLESIQANITGSVASFIHINSFTETIVFNPYERKRTPYKRHIRHLVEVDFTQSKEDVIKYISKMYEKIQPYTKKDKYTTEPTEIKYFNDKLNYGDFLFIRDCKVLNITQQDTVNEINVYREIEQDIKEKTTVRNVSILLKKMKEEKYNLDLLTPPLPPLEITVSFV